MKEAQIDDDNEGPVEEMENNFDFLLSPNDNDECMDDCHAAGHEVINQIKEKLAETTDPSEKILLLILAPKSWGRRKLMKEFNTSERQAKKTKKLVAESDNFVEHFCNKLFTLKPHSFTAKQQSLFIKDLKNALQGAEFLILFHFAENFAFIVQITIQSQHWNNDQTIIFTVLIYYIENNKLKNISTAILSDNLNHDTTSVLNNRT